MRRLGMSSVVAALLAGAVVLNAQTQPSGSEKEPDWLKDVPGPEKEHEWLKQLVGEWESESEMIMVPGQPPHKTKGKESVRAIGGLWVVSELTCESMMGPMTALMTLGYDAEKKKYVGTWIDSMMNHMWHYQGTLDATGKILTLEAEGPNMMDPSKRTKYRDAIEIKNKDHKILTSSALGEDGKWITFGTTNFRRTN